MYHVDNSTAVAAPPASTTVGPNPNGFYSDGVPANGTPATIADAEHLNILQKKIARTIEGSGMILSKSDPGQLFQSIRLLQAARGT